MAARMSSGRLSKLLRVSILRISPEMLTAQLFQAIQKLANVRLSADKGIADQVRVLDDELQRLQIVGGERGNVDARLRQVDAFLGAKVLPFRTRLRDFNGRRIRVYRAEDAADLPVVKPDRFAGFGVIEHLWQRDANAGGRDQLTRLAIGCGLF